MCSLSSSSSKVKSSSNPCEEVQGFSNQLAVVHYSRAALAAAVAIYFPSVDTPMVLVSSVNHRDYRSVLDDAIDPSCTCQI